MLKDLTPWIPFLSLVFVVLAYFRNVRKDKDEQDEKEDKTLEGLKESIMKVDIKLDQVFTTTSETRADIKSLNKDMLEIDRRVTVLESKVDKVTK